MEDWSRERKQSSDGKVNKDMEFEEIEDEEEGEVYESGGSIVEEDEKKKGACVMMSVRRGSSSTSVGRVSPACCQAEGCGADLTFAKRYHRRHKVCELHSKAAMVIVAGLRKRFCQQCSRFHELAEFDEAKRSCRRRLARHNERRRKSSTVGTYNTAGMNGEQHPLDQSHCGNDNVVVDWRNIQMNMAISSSHNLFNFR